MNSFQDDYKNFFTFKDLDVQRNLIYLSAFPENQLITPELLFSDNSGLTTFVLKKGDKWADLLFAGWPGLYLISERTRDILCESSGVNFIPVNILNSTLKEIKVNYYRIQVLSTSGPLVKEMSRKEVATRIANGPKYLRQVGLYFTPGSWDGSDFFTPKNTLNILVTSKIKALVDNSRLTNILMKPISEVETF